MLETENVKSQIPYKRTNGSIEFFDDCLVLPPAGASEPNAASKVYGAPKGKLIELSKLFDGIFGGAYKHLTIVRVGVKLFDCVDPRVLDEVLSAYENDEEEYNANCFDIARTYH